jgi:hypothetical protein
LARLRKNTTLYVLFIDLPLRSSVLHANLTRAVLEIVQAIDQCRINHMAEAAYAAGPALLGAPRLLSSIFPRIFVPCFIAGPNQCASAGPQRAQAPGKREAPKGLLCSLFQCISTGPQEPKVPRKRQAPNLKIEAAMSGAPNGFLSPVSARGPKESKAPQKRSSKRKNREAPKFKKRGSNCEAPIFLFLL